LGRSVAEAQMRAASRFRRRVLSAVFVAASALLLLTPAEYVPPGMRWKGLLAAPAFLLLGAVGLAYPKAVPDPRPPAGAIGAVAEAGSPGLVFGGCVFFVGLAVGAWLAFGG
jgi:hypothetical protein